MVLYQGIANQREEREQNKPKCNRTQHKQANLRMPTNGVLKENP